jgi:hypothetical protein
MENKVGLEPLLSVYRCNLDACRQMAALMVDGAQRLDGIGFKLARATVEKTLHAAPGESNVPHVDLSDFVQAQRELNDAFVDIGQQFMRAFNDYGSMLNQTVASNLNAPGATPNAFGADAIANMTTYWNDAARRFDGLMQSLTSAAPPVKPAGASAKTRQRAGA